MQVNITLINNLFHRLVPRLQLEPLRQQMDQTDQKPHDAQQRLALHGLAQKRIDDAVVRLHLVQLVLLVVQGCLQVLGYQTNVRRRKKIIG